jgi:hypothetical protein
MEYFNNIIENTKLEPVVNGYQYLIIFMVIFIIINPILYFFSSRKYRSIRMTPPVDMYGFAPDLYPFYRSLGEYKFISKHISDSPTGTTYDKVITGGLVFGITALIILIVTDVILYIMNNSKENNNNY